MLCSSFVFAEFHILFISVNTIFSRQMCSTLNSAQYIDAQNVPQQDS